MYLFASLGPDYGRVHGKVTDFEVALEEVHRFADWVIIRIGAGPCVAWRKQNGTIEHHEVPTYSITITPELSAEEIAALPRGREIGIHGTDGAASIIEAAHFSRN